MKEYYTDEAINSPLEDELEQQYFAYYLAKGLNTLNVSKTSFVVGICGKWGDGKTSTVNMALNYLPFLIEDSNLSIDELNKKFKKNPSLSIDKLNAESKQKYFTIRNVIFSSLIFLSFIFFFYFIVGLILKLIIIKFYSEQIANLVVNILVILFAYFFIERYFIPSVKLLFKKVEILKPLKQITGFILSSLKKKKSLKYILNHGIIRTLTKF